MGFGNYDKNRLPWYCHYCLEDFRGGETIFNQAQFQMIRLHELMTTVNECWVNFGGMVDNLPAHQVLFNVLSGYLMEIEPTFNKEESDIAIKRLEAVEQMINTIPLWTYRVNNGIGGTTKTRVMNYQAFFRIRKELREFQLTILRFAQAHGIGNPTKKDPRKAVLN